MAITKVYTRRGDSGTTSLVGVVRVKKTNARIEAYGTLDELSSQLGVLAATMAQGADRNLIIDIQRRIFSLSSYLATPPKDGVPPTCYLTDDDILRLEQEIDAINATLPSLPSFILPGGSQCAAFAHVCRTVCRRAERRICSLAEETPLDPKAQGYVNRLSDYLFVLARKLNVAAGVEEILWIKPKP